MESILNGWIKFADKEKKKNEKMYDEGLLKKTKTNNKKQ